MTVVMFPFAWRNAVIVGRRFVGLGSRIQERPLGGRSFASRTNGRPPLSLKNVVMSTITPFEKRDHVARIYPTTKFDLMALNCYTPYAFFYKPQEGQLGSFKLVDLLKESLSKVLVPFFPFAGRWARTSDPRVTVLQCSDAGVPFIEASTDAELNSVLDPENPVITSGEVLSGYKLVGLQKDPVHQVIDDRFPLFVQVTQFKCGGFALHVTVCHMTADAKGFTTFMNAWSEIALHGQTSIIPCHDRSRVSSPVVSLEFDANTGTKDIANGNVDKDMDLIIEKLRAVSEPNIHKMFHVKRDIIENFKREAAEKNDMQTSTVNLIVAHCWRCISNLPQSIDGKTRSSANIVVEGRQRFHNPPLPDHFTGNAAIVTELPQLSAIELSANSLSFAANAVRKTVHAINSSTWEDCVARFDKVDCRQILFTSMFRFPVYEVIFSRSFGGPVYAGINSTYALEIGLLTAGVVVNPPPPSLSKDTIATLDVVVKESPGHALFSDPQFLSFMHRFQ